MALDADSSGEAAAACGELLQLLRNLDSPDRHTAKDLLTFIDAVANKHGNTTATAADKSFGEELHVSDMLMERDASSLVGGSSNGKPAARLYVKDRESGLLVEENIPRYISVALKATVSGLGRVLGNSRSSIKLMEKLSVCILISCINAHATTNAVASYRRFLFVFDFVSFNQRFACLWSLARVLASSSCVALSHCRFVRAVNTTTRNLSKYATLLGMLVLSFPEPSVVDKKVLSCLNRVL